MGLIKRKTRMRRAQCVRHALLFMVIRRRLGGVSACSCCCWAALGLEWRRECKTTQRTKERLHPCWCAPSTNDKTKLILRLARPDHFAQLSALPRRRIFLLLSCAAAKWWTCILRKDLNLMHTQSQKKIVAFPYCLRLFARDGKYIGIGAEPAFYTSWIV